MATEQRFARITDHEIAAGFIAVAGAYPDGNFPGIGTGNLPRLIRAGLRALPHLPPEHVREVWEAAELRPGWPAREVAD